MRFLRFCVSLCALAAFSAAPIAAQDHASHTSGTHVTMGGNHGTGGRFGSTGGRSANGAGPDNHHHHHNGHFGFGAPILLPYDTEYDQLEGRGLLDQEPPPEATRVGPTIFEHDGRPSTASDSEPAPQAPQQPAASNPEPQVETVLIFRDGHQQEVANYAITGSGLIVVGEKPQRIELSDLDLDATAKVNLARGVEFRFHRRG